MPADATIRALRSAIDADRGDGAVSDDLLDAAGQDAVASQPPTFAARSFAGQSVEDVNLEEMTVGELAAMIGEMQRMIVGLGAQLGARTSEAEAQFLSDQSDDEALVPSDVERLAEILSAIERSRVA